MATHGRARARQMMGQITQHSRARSSNGISIAKRPQEERREFQTRPRPPINAGSSDPIGEYPYKVVDARGGLGMTTLTRVPR